MQAILVKGEVWECEGYRSRWVRRGLSALRTTPWLNKTGSRLVAAGYHDKAVRDALRALPAPQGTRTLREVVNSLWRIS